MKNLPRAICTNGPLLSIIRSVHVAVLLNGVIPFLEVGIGEELHIMLGNNPARLVHRIDQCGVQPGLSGYLHKRSPNFFQCFAAEKFGNCRLRIKEERIVCCGFPSELYPEQPLFGGHGTPVPRLERAGFYSINLKKG